MEENFSVVMVKPLSVGRGDTIPILSQLINDGKLSLHHTRCWVTCNTTWSVLCKISEGTESEFDSSIVDALPSGRKSVIFLLKGDRSHLDSLIGPMDRSKWTKDCLRRRFNILNHRSDDVFYVSPVGKTELVASLLFENFDKSNYLDK